MWISSQRERCFTPMDKFDSGCGWPSFTQLVAGDTVTEHTDSCFGAARRGSPATGGLTFGPCIPRRPKDKGGLRYCINQCRRFGLFPTKN